MQPKVKTLTEILTKEQIEVAFTLKDAHLINLIVIMPNYKEISAKAGRLIPPQDIAQAIEYAIFRADEDHRKQRGKQLIN
jgi:hypothetical protein